MKFFVAVIDQDEIYLDRLTKYFCDNFNDRVELYAFSTTLSFFAFLKKARVDMILINESSVEDGVYELNIPVLLLVEYPISIKYKEKIIEKYISCEELYKNILKYASEELYISDSNNSNTKCKVYMSISNYCEDFITAVASLKELEGQNLLLDLSTFSISKKYVENNSKASLSDFIISLRNSEIDHALKLEAYTNKFEDVDILLGYDNPCDSLSFEERDIENLIRTMELSKYDNILIFMNDFIGDKYIKIFDRADVIIYSVFESANSDFLLDRTNKIIKTYENKSNLEFADKIRIYNLSDYNFNINDRKIFSNLSKEPLWNM